MKYRWHEILLYMVLMSAPGVFYAQNNSTPSLEMMEQQSESVEDATPVPESTPSMMTESSPVASEPASSVGSGLNINEKITRVIDPNLFSGSVPAIYKRQSLNIVGKRPDLSVGEAPDEYVVQEGDTLYDICDQLLDDHDYWPKLWSLNPEAGMGIVNPHFIYPGMRLRFRTEGVPSLVIEQASETIPIGDAEPQALVSESLNSIPSIEDSSQPSRVLGPDDVESIAGIADMFVDEGERIRSGRLDLISPGFIADYEKTFPPLGEVIGGSSGAALNTKKSEVIIEKESELELDKVYSIFRKKGKVYSASENDYVGFRFEFVAHVRITSKDTADDDILRGIVLLDRTGVLPGDVILPFQSVKRVVNSLRTPAGSGADQEVIGFDEHSMTIGGRGSFVFLGQTPESQLEKGKAYDIVQNVKEVSPKFLKDRLPDTYRTVGRVVILDSLPNSALAYVLSDSTEIRLGDRIKR